MGIRLTDILIEMLGGNVYPTDRHTNRDGRWQWENCYLGISRQKQKIDSKSILDSIQQKENLFKRNLTNGTCVGI